MNLFSVLLISLFRLSISSWFHLEIFLFLEMCPFLPGCPIFWRVYAYYYHLPFKLLKWDGRGASDHLNTNRSFLCFPFKITYLKIKNKLWCQPFVFYALCFWSPSWVGQEVGTLCAFAQYLLVQQQRCRKFVQWIRFNLTYLWELSASCLSTFHVNLFALFKSAKYPCIRSHFQLLAMCFVP